MPDASTQPTQRMYPVGIPGDELEQAERMVPQDEPPPLPVNEKLKVIGKPTTRLDGRSKVTGAAKYTADVNPPGMLFARMVCSPYPHAKVKSIDVSAAANAPGVKAVHIVEKLLGVAEEKTKPGEEKAKYPM